MYKKFIFFIIALLSTYTCSDTKSKLTNVKRLKLRIGDTKEVRGYSKVTADPEDAVHIYNVDKNTIAITGQKLGAVDLDFYDEEGEKTTSKSLYIKDLKPEPDVNISFGFGVGGCPYPAYCSSDHFYDPLHGWRGINPYWGEGWGWHGDYHHRKRCR